MAQTHSPWALPDERDMVVVLYLGSQYTHMITRHLHELKVHTQLLPGDQKVCQWGFKPKGIIISSGPYNIKETDAPHVDPMIFQLGVPILGIGYGLQEIVYHVHGPASTSRVLTTGERKYSTEGMQVVASDRLFDGWTDMKEVFLSQGDQLHSLPHEFRAIGKTRGSDYAAVVHRASPVYGLQFHPEAPETQGGGELLKNFAIHICGASQTWSLHHFIKAEIRRIRELVGPDGHVLGALSGGVDSTVSAKLAAMAIGENFHAVHVDNGLMRLGESKRVQKVLEDDLGIKVALIDGGQKFLAALSGIEDPEEKRKSIGHTFVDIFEREAHNLRAKYPGKLWFLQGTLYLGTMQSVVLSKRVAPIKTYHNDGEIAQRLTRDLGLGLLEPLGQLFKPEVREIAKELHICTELGDRHPFPGPGLAIRVLGAVTEERIQTARHADHIFLSMVKEAGLYGQVSQVYAALDQSKAVGVVNDQRRYGHIIILRAVCTEDFVDVTPYAFQPEFLAAVSTRIIREVPGVARVVYDITPKPPGTVELE